MSPSGPFRLNRLHRIGGQRGDKRAELRQLREKLHIPLELRRIETSRQDLRVILRSGERILNERNAVRSRIVRCSCAPGPSD